MINERAAQAYSTLLALGLAPFKPAAETYNHTMAVQLKKIADADFPTRWGRFRIMGFEGTIDNPHSCRTDVAAPAIKIEQVVALVMGDVATRPGDDAPVVRVHSQCLTGDVFGSVRCDCRAQLELALAAISKAGRGVLVYELQEGRGIGLMAKLRAYELQDQGRDTVEANLELGYEADCREFEVPAAVLRNLGVDVVRLMTNNPEKVQALEAAGVRVVERISAAVEPVETFERYLLTKQEKMGHIDDRQLDASSTNAGDLDQQISDRITAVLEPADKP